MKRGRNLPDLILMDISVPELDGWEATAILKADPATKHIPDHRGHGARAARATRSEAWGRLRRVSGEADSAGDAACRSRSSLRATPRRRTIAIRHADAAPPT